MSASTNGNTTNGGGGGGSSAASASVTVETETASLAGSDEPVLSMTDVLRSQMEVERRAVEIASKGAVAPDDLPVSCSDRLVGLVGCVLLAPEFEKCSYGDGYSDQPVYACATCHPKDSGVQAGFCYGCSMTWYDGRCLQPTLSMADAGLRVAVYRVCSHVEHDVYELFIKRHFRCDCGNSLSGGRYKCELQAVKDATNPQNKYNHNCRYTAPVACTASPAFPYLIACYCYCPLYCSLSAAGQSTVYTATATNHTTRMRV